MAARSATRLRGDRDHWLHAGGGHCGPDPGGGQEITEIKRGSEVYSVIGDVGLVAIVRVHEHDSQHDLDAAFALGFNGDDPSRVNRAALADMDQHNTRRNSLNAIRLFLAGTVLVSHCWPLSGSGQGLSIGGQTLGSMAVAGFFAISGYLIADSRNRLSLPRFAWHRFLRIFPGYWVMLAVTAFVLAPAVSAAADERWTLRASLLFVFASFTTRIYTFAIEGTLLSTPFGGALSGGPWNGSTWTLYYEVLCYAAAGVLLSLRVVRSRGWPLLTLLAFLAVVQVGSPPSSGTSALLLPLAIPFVAGSALWSLREKAPFRPGIAALAGITMVATLPTGLFPALGAPALGYLLLWAGYTFPIELGQRTDLSYGVYIYAFPLQQAAADLGVRSVVPLLLITAAMVVPAAFASWHLVERPALRGKSWDPLPRPPAVQHRTQSSPVPGPAGGGAPG